MTTWEDEEDDYEMVFRRSPRSPCPRSHPAVALSEKKKISKNSDDNNDDIRQYLLLGDDGDTIFYPDALALTLSTSTSLATTSASKAIGQWQTFDAVAYLNDIWRSFGCCELKMLRQLEVDFPRQHYALVAHPREAGEQEQQCTSLARLIDVVTSVNVTTTTTAIAANKYHLCPTSGKVQINILGQSLDTILLMLCTQASFAHLFGFLQQYFRQIHPHLMLIQSSRPSVTLLMTSAKKNTTTVTVVMRIDFRLLDTDTGRECIKIESSLSIQLGSTQGLITWIATTSKQ